MALSRQLNAAAHGHIHELLGGSWNHNFGAKNNFETSPAIFTFAHEILQNSKELWRTEFVACPSYCGVDTPWDECKCSCDNSEKDLSSYKPFDILMEAGVLAGMQYFDSERHIVSGFVNDTTGEPNRRIPGYSVSESHELYANALEDLCEPGHSGDMFQATSPNDMTFWVLHPTVDRLWCVCLCVCLCVCVRVCAQILVAVWGQILVNFTHQILAHAQALEAPR